MATDTQEQQSITEADFAGHEFLTAAETIVYLRLDKDDCNASWRLKNLMRFQGLPFLRRGRLLLFRRTALNEWLERGPSVRRQPAASSAVAKRRKRSAAAS